MTSIVALALVAVVAGTIVSSVAQGQEPARTTVIHTREAFSFMVNAPYDETFPLFGAYEERKWAVGFDPHFVFPPSAHDQQGMVFTTEQEGMKRVWLNTLFDRATGHAQYAYFIADTMVALIDVHLESSGTAETRVNVAYERTALKPEANPQVAAAAQRDATSGPRWAEAINGYLANSGKRAER